MPNTKVYTMKKKQFVFIFFTAIISISSVAGGYFIYPALNDTTDTTAPTIEIINPLNSVYNDASQLLVINATDDTEIDTIWFNWDGMNITYTAAQVIMFNEGQNTIKVWANDSTGNIKAISITFIIDETIPTIEITSPLNTLYEDNSQLLAITATDETEIDTIWYSWKGTNVTYSAAQQIVFS
jgi:hypothetical protein